MCQNRGTEWRKVIVLFDFSSLRVCRSYDGEDKWRKTDLILIFFDFGGILNGRTGWRKGGGANSSL